MTTKIERLSKGRYLSFSIYQQLENGDVGMRLERNRDWWLSLNGNGTEMVPTGMDGGREDFHSHGGPPPSKSAFTDRIKVSRLI